jgi:hypothetical protein
MKSSFLLAAGAMVLGVWFGCGGISDGPGKGSLDNGEGPCKSNSDCFGGSVGITFCLDLADDTGPNPYCTEECRFDNTCAHAGFYCDTQTFASKNLKVCRRLGPGMAQPEPGQPVQAPPPSAPPRLLCDGAQTGSCPNGTVCATFMGITDCTIPCAREEDCTFTFPGVKIDMHNCAADQTPGVSRNVCLPDLSCFMGDGIDRCFQFDIGGGGMPGSPCSVNSDCSSNICNDVGGGFKICM